jgi:hypothetical protein
MIIWKVAILFAFVSSSLFAQDTTIILIGVDTTGLVATKTYSDYGDAVNAAQVVDSSAAIRSDLGALEESQAIIDTAAAIRADMGESSTEHIGNSDLSLTGNRALATGSYDLNIDANTLVVDGSADRVGIGTSTPSADLDVVGTTELNGNTLITGGKLSISDASNYSEMIKMGVNLSNISQIKTDGLFAFKAGTGSINYYNATTFFARWVAGNLAIGNQFPSAALDVAGNVQFDDYGLETIGGSTAGVVLVADTDGNIMDNSEIYTDGSGNVGIGTTSPSAKLDVVGNIAVSGTVDGVDIASLSSDVTAAEADIAANAKRIIPIQVVGRSTEIAVAEGESYFVVPPEMNGYTCTSVEYKADSGTGSFTLHIRDTDVSKSSTTVANTTATTWNITDFVINTKDIIDFNISAVATSGIKGLSATISCE